MDHLPRGLDIGMRVRAGEGDSRVGGALSMQLRKVKQHLMSEMGAIS